MITVADLSPRDLLHSLRSVLCPICGGKKGSGKTVCFRCWRLIPAKLRNPLYQRIGEGYEQAVAALFTRFDVPRRQLALRLGVADAPAAAGECCPECNGLGCVFDCIGASQICPRCGGDQ